MLRRIEPLTGLLVLACAGWSLAARGLGWTEAEAGALRADRLWDGEYWRLFTAALLHDLRGWFHLLCNVLGLALIGPMVARESGRRTYAACLLFSVMAGWVASLGWYPSPRIWHLGISGGLLGLVGLLLAVEWAMAAGLGGFLKQRNTWVLLAVVVLGAAATEYMNRRAGAGAHLFASQAGHAGGFLFGVLFGLFLYGRPRCRRRPALGAVAVLVFGMLPVAYLCFPFANGTFLLYRGERAWADERPDRAAFYFGLALRFDGGSPLAGARLAVHRDDPALLEDLRPPEDLTRVQLRLTLGTVAGTLLQAHLELARRRLEDDPDRAAALVESARRIHPADPLLWQAFAVAARSAGKTELARDAFAEARKALGAAVARAIPAGAELELWLASVEDVPPDQRHATAARAAETVQAAALGLASLDGEDKAALESNLARLAVWIGEVARETDPDGGLAARLAGAYWLLANNTAVPEREAAYLWQRALLMDREAALGRLDPAEVVPAMRGVLGAAREYGDAETAARVETWFSARGLPVPDLAPPDGHG